MDIRKLVENNLADVRRRIAEACERAGRAADEVTLVAVTKTVEVDVIRMLHELGVRDFGENRVAQAEERIAALSDLDARWHMIGHLQRNKAKKAVPLFPVIHSIDSLRLARAVSEQAAKQGRVAEGLIQVNTSGEESKFGLEPDEVRAVHKETGGLEGLRVVGLMTMAPFYDDPEQCRPCFRALRELRDELAGEDASLTHLSMGMTNDFEVAIEEGADLIRVGSALFHGIVPATQH